MPSITKRTRTRGDGSKYVVYRAQMRDPDKPASRNANVERTFSRRRDAEAWLSGTSTAVTSGTYVTRRDAETPLSEVAEDWRATWNHHPSPKTQASYRAILRRHIEPEWGTHKIASVGAPEIQAWIDALASDHAPQTVHNAYTVLRGLLKFALSRKLIPFNPCSPDAIRLPSKTRHRRQPKRQLHLEAHELRQLVDAMPEHWRLAVKLDGLCGLRAGELWGLTKGDVELDANPPTLHVRRAIKDVGGELQIGSTKTGGSRSFTIPATLVPDLKAALSPSSGIKTRHGYAAVREREDGPELGWTRKADDEDRLLFTTPNGHPVSQGNFYERTYRPTVAKLWPEGNRLHELRFHDLRHTSASLTIDATGATQASLVIVKERLGHSNIKTTIDVYGHLTKNADMDLADELSAMYERQVAGDKVVSIKQAKGKSA